MGAMALDMLVQLIEKKDLPEKKVLVDSKLIRLFISFYNS